MEFAFDESLSRMRELGRDAGRRHAAPTVEARDAAGAWNPRLLAELAASGVARAAIPAVYGGLGSGVLETAALLEGFGEGSGDAGLALAVGVHSLMCAVPLAVLGTQSQADRYLPRIASGDWLGGMALAESHGGAAADGFEVIAVRTADGWLLDGGKDDVINAPDAHHFVVTAVTSADRSTAFVIDRDTPGVTVVPDAAQSMVRTCRTAVVEFENCRVGPQAVLGTPGGAAAELVPLLAALDRTCMLAPWLGILREVLRLGQETAARRYALGRPLTHSQTVRATLVDGQTLVEMASGLLYRAAWRLDQPGPAPRRESAAAKMFLSRAMRDLTRAIAQFSGTSAHDLVRRAYRDSLMLAVSGGGEEVLRPIIAIPWQRAA